MDKFGNHHIQDFPMSLSAFLTLLEHHWSQKYGKEWVRRDVCYEDVMDGLVELGVTNKGIECSHACQCEFFDHGRIKCACECHL